jgi:hypothetical protein
VPHDNDNDFQRNDVYSKRIRAGKRRTYFFDVRTTKANDYYLTITESKKRFNDDGYDRHKVFIYKEDFNKFIHTLEEVIDHIKNNLMPDYDFDAFTRDPEDITYDDDEVFEEHDRKDSSEDKVVESPAPKEIDDKIEFQGDDEEAIRWD